jgi:hypothetical protein
LAGKPAISKYRLIASRLEMLKCFTRNEISSPCEQPTKHRDHDRSGAEVNALSREFVPELGLQQRPRAAQSDTSPTAATPHQQNQNCGANQRDYDRADAAKTIREERKHDLLLRTSSPID